MSNNNNNQGGNMDDNVFGEVIDSYTRADAIADGVLVDVSEMAKEAGYKYPCCITSAVQAVINQACENKRACNDYKGVLWDVLWMSRFGRSVDESTKMFKVIITGVGRKRNHILKIQVHGGDNREPVITVMFPNED